MGPAEIENAKKEAAFLKSLNHPNIVRCDGLFSMVFPFIFMLLCHVIRSYVESFLDRGKLWFVPCESLLPPSPAPTPYPSSCFTAVLLWATRMVGTCPRRFSR